MCMPQHWQTARDTRSTALPSAAARYREKSAAGQPRRCPVDARETSSCSRSPTAPGNGLSGPARRNARIGTSVDIIAPVISLVMPPCAGLPGGSVNDSFFANVQVSGYLSVAGIHI
jgi:hypothetical protein